MDFGDHDNMLLGDRDRLTITSALHLGLLQFYNLASEEFAGGTVTASNLTGEEIQEYLEKFFEVEQQFIEDLLSEAREMGTVTIPLKRLELVDEWKPVSVSGAGADW